MILILSEEGDSSTNEVIDWLIHKKMPHIRINDTTRLKLNSIKVSAHETSFNLLIEDALGQQPFSISSNQINGFWYRRGALSFPFNLQLEKDKYKENEKIVNQLISHLNENQNDVIYFLYNYLKRVKNLGSFYDNSTIKIYNQHIALECGLQIPATTVITNKLDLIAFKKVYKKCITKGIAKNSFGIIGEIGVGCLTQMIEDADIENLPENFAPSLVQEYISKLFELRIFYINENFYTAVIFSQQDKKTQIDFRNYNYDRPNRMVPYKLPKEIELKLVSFMNTVGMKTGSIDILVSPKLEYVFLEVNPVGQFSWVSKNCNFYIEEEIANYFKN